MDEATGEAEGSGLRVAFDRRLKLEFHGATVTSDAGLLAFRELDDALGLTEMAAEVLADTRTGRNGRHSLIAQLRQSVFGRLAGYEDVNDADRLGRDPAMRWIVGGRAVTEHAASTSQMGRFETGAMTAAAGERAQCPRVARGARSGGRAVSWPGPPALAARRCGLRAAGRVRVPGGGGLPVRDPPARQPGAPESDRPPAHAARGTPTTLRPALLRELPLSGAEL